MVFKDLLRHSAVYTLTGFLSRGVSLIIFPLVVRSVSKEDFAVYDYTLVINTILLIVLPLEITQGLARYFNECETKVEQDRLCATVTNFTLLVHIPLVLVTLLFSKSISIFLYESDTYQWLIVYALLFSISYNLAHTFRSEYKWRLKPWVNTVLTLLSSGTILVLITLFWYKSWLDLKSVFLIMIVANSLSVIGGFYVSKNSYSLSLNIKELKHLLRFSIPLVPSSLGVIFAMYIDRLMVKELLSLSELAEYGIGFRIASIAALGFIGIQGALSPLIYKHYREAETPKKLGDLFTAFFIAIFTLLVGAQIFLEDIVVLLATDAYRDSWRISSLLIFATVLWQLYIFFPGLSIEKKTKTIGLLNIIFAFVNLMLNYFLIKPFGLIGAGLATLISSSLFMITYAVVSQKHYPIIVNKKVVIGFGVAVVTGLGLVYGDTWSELQLFGHIAFKMGVFILLALVSWQLIRKRLSFKLSLK